MNRFSWILRKLGAVLLLCVLGQGAFAQMAPDDSGQAGVRAITAETSGWLTRTTTIAIDLDHAIPFGVSGGADGLVQVTLSGVDAQIRPAFQSGGVVLGYDLAPSDAGATLTLRAGRELTLQTAQIVSPLTGGAQLLLRFEAGGRLADVIPEPLAPVELSLPLVVLDPGHGGVDPGAVRQNISEKDIALAFGLELRTVLEQSGRFEVLMTRDTDVFVTLRDRVRFAREAGAAVFISLHANTVTRGNASGSAIYTLSEGATSREAAELAVLENRADTVGGVDLGVEDNDLALLLTDMAQRETNARSAMLARATVQAMRHAVGVIRTNPHRSAGFRVLKAPDIPSMLIELGFLSDETDRANMISPRWRAHAAQGILAALDDWVERDRVLSAQARAGQPVDGHAAPDNLAVAAGE